MGFGFLAGGALVLGVLVLGPILAHLARRTPTERQPFGAMLLVQRLLRRTRRRRRLRDQLILLLRAGAVLLVVLAVARPELRLPDASLRVGSSGRLVVVLDNSLSMSLRQGSPGAPVGASLLSRAREQALALVDELPEGVALGAVVTAGSGGQVVALSPVLTEDHELVSAGIQAVEPSFQATDLAGALRAARALLAGGPGEVVVFSDEAGEGPVRAAATELERLVAAGCRVVPRTLRSEQPSNLVVRAAEYGDGVEGGSIRVRLAGFGPDPVEAAVTVTLPDDGHMTAFVMVPPCIDALAEQPGDVLPADCSEAEVLFTVPPEVPGGVASVEVDDGVLAADDVFWFHLPRVGASRVLVVDGDPGPTPIRSEIYFLERALAPWGSLGSGIKPDITAPAGIHELDPERHRVVFLANVADPRPLADALSAFVRGGGGLVITAGENLTPERYNAALSQLLPAPLRRVRNLVDLDAEGGVPVVMPRVDDPSGLYAPFVRRGMPAFSEVHARRLLTFEPFEDSDEVHTLLALQNGLPFLVDRQVGPGRVVVLAGTADLAWGNLPLQSAFLPLVQRLVTWLGAGSGGSVARFSGVVGQALDIPLPAVGIEPLVADPEGRELLAEYKPGRVSFTPRLPGPYTLALPGAPPLAWVAVNTPPEESDVNRYADLAAVEAELDPQLLQRRVGLGAGALALALLLLLGQALIARTQAAS